MAVILFAEGRDGAAYDRPNTKTDKTGTFGFMLARVALRPASVLPDPDTLTVTIVGIDLRSTTSPPLQDSVRVLVRFVPPDEPAPITTATLLTRTP
jgi:hypothetical protein